MISINKNAMKLIREILAEADNLGVKVSRLECGATNIDMGINCKGSWRAGLLFSRITLGDMAEVRLGEFVLDEYTLASSEVYVEEPLIACLGSQIAGWKLGEGEFATIGSGPARAVAAVKGDYYLDMTPYRDKNEEVVLCIQDIKMPTNQLAIMVAEACRVKPEDVYFVIAPSASLVGAIQVASRTVEQICHKMFNKGFDVKQIVCARGKAPIPPITLDEVKAMGRLNDALLYGGTAEFWVESTDEAIEGVINKLVSKYSSPEYGALFGEIFDRAGRDFYYIDHDVHSLAKIQIHNVRTGKAFTSGEIRYDILTKSFLS